MKALKVLGFSLFSLVLLFVVGPFLVPVSPLKGVKPVEELADPDSRFAEIDGYKLHYKVYGDGRPAIILLHGFGASSFSFRNVTDAISKLGKTVAYDRPAQGLTERPLHGQWHGENPYSLSSQPALLIKLMDQLGIEKAVLIGNSAGGTVAAQTAIDFPDRVQGLVLVDAAVYQGGPQLPAWIQPLLNSSQAGRIGPLLVRSIQDRGMQILYTAWHDPSRISPDITAGYRKPLMADNWDKGLWELVIAPRRNDLQQHLGEIRQPVLVVTGDDDRIVPTMDSQRLASEIPGAQLAVFKNCGHVPHEECPDQFLDVVLPFINAIK
jgi:pimeloyl-ACP methyl ester carboxylesterase